MRLYGSYSRTVTLGNPRRFSLNFAKYNKRGGAYCEPRRDAKNLGNHSEMTFSAHINLKYIDSHAFRHTECDYIA